MDLFSKPRVASEDAISVTQLLRRMKHALEERIGEVWIEGEVSNLRKQASGHWYFSLKDAGAQIQCAMFGARKRQGAEALEDGANVRVFAEASVYEARGQLQVIVQKAEAAGSGDLQARFEALKRKLHAEGLFDEASKKPLPKIPKVIGLITSPTGAALQDMLNVLSRRAPWVQPVLYPVRVQGKGAELEIAEAIERMGQPEVFGLPRCEVLIVGRGGGSIEDLWNFNEEVVARAIAACPIPIISAVGHEIDFTIADFAADVRAPTPSAAAEMAVADGETLQARLGQLSKRMQRQVTEKLRHSQVLLETYQRGALRRDGEYLLREATMRLDTMRMRLQQVMQRDVIETEQALSLLSRRHQTQHPLRVMERRADLLLHARGRIERAAHELLSKQERQLQQISLMLRTLGPESTFQRGFSMTLGPDGKAVRSAVELRAGDLLVTYFADGETKSRVES